MTARSPFDELAEDIQRFQESPEQFAVVDTLLRQADGLIKLREIAVQALTDQFKYALVDHYTMSGYGDNTLLICNRDDCDWLQGYPVAHDLTDILRGALDHELSRHKYEEK